MEFIQLKPQQSINFYITWLLCSPNPFSISLCVERAVYLTNDEVMHIQPKDWIGVEIRVTSRNNYFYEQ